MKIYRGFTENYLLALLEALKDRKHPGALMNVLALLDQENIEESDLESFAIDLDDFLEQYHEIENEACKRMLKNAK